MSEEELYKLLNIPYKPWIELTDEEIQLFEKNNNYIKQLQQENTNIKNDKEAWEQLWFDKCENLKKQLKETNNCLELQISNVTLLEKELKDKDEKISNLIKLLVEMVFDDINYLGVYQELVARHLVKLGYIVKEDGFYKELESNKEERL